MDNPQGTLVSEAEVGWLSGILDGEGCVTAFFGVRKSGKLSNVSPQVMMGNTDQAIVDKYIDILKRLGVGVYVSARKPQHRTGVDGATPTTKQYKQLYMASTVGFLRCQRLLRIVRPHLAGDKRERADAILALIDSRLERCVSNGKYSNVPYSHKDLQLIYNVSLLIKTKHAPAIEGLLRDSERSSGLQAR
jgi:hypothetical protein